MNYYYKLGKDLLLIFGTRMQLLFPNITTDIRRTLYVYGYAVMPTIPSSRLHLVSMSLFHSEHVRYLACPSMSLFQLVRWPFSHRISLTPMIVRSPPVCFKMSSAAVSLPATNKDKDSRRIANKDRNKSRNFLMTSCYDVTRREKLNRQHN